MPAGTACRSHLSSAIVDPQEEGKLAWKPVQQVAK
jgi:hypothetical protein